MQTIKVKISIPVDTFCDMVSFVLITMKLLGKTDISWGKAFMPMLIGTGIVVLLGVASGLSDKEG